MIKFNYLLSRKSFTLDLMVSVETNKIKIEIKYRFINVEVALITAIHESD